MKHHTAAPTDTGFASRAQDPRPQARRHRRHANPFTIRGPVEVPDWEAIFGRKADFALDIGCGPGRFVRDLAQAMPHLNVLGLEIREHLVEETRALAKEAGLANAWAMMANASCHMAQLLPPESVAFVSVNFPDPWYKKRHHKRRVVQPDWLTGLCGRLRPGAVFHAMTDYEPVALQILETLNSHPDFHNRIQGAGYAPQSTTGVLSEREIKHLQRGERIFRLHFTYGLCDLGKVR